MVGNMKRLFRNIGLFITIAVLAITVVPQVNTYAAEEAVECDLEFYETNDILYYNPCADFCTVEGAATAGKIGTVHGANNAEKIYNFWIDAGLSTQVAAGVTGSMKHEGGFSPFRQEMSQSWPNGGWGIAQFTFDPGQRGAVKEYLIAELGQDLFNQYYQPQYGGPVMESKGFIPDGISVEVNDKFLLGELNYLLQHVKELKPNNIRRDAYTRDFAKTIDPATSLYDYLADLQSAGDAAVAWTYLYEYPGDIKNTSLERAKSADELAALFSGGGAEAGVCGGLAEGGMTLEQAKKFMAVYKQIDDGDPNGDRQYLSGACNTLTDNCVTFASYFIKKYTNLQFGINNGAMVVNSTLALNEGLDQGTEPRPFSLFGTKKGVTLCDWDGNGTAEAPCGHTGIVLGVDRTRKVVIVGEAAYCNDSFTAAREYPLDEWSDGSYRYAYLEPHLKDMKALMQ